MSPRSDVTRVSPAGPGRETDDDDGRSPGFRSRRRSAPSRRVCASDILQGRSFDTVAGTAADLHRVPYSLPVWEHRLGARLGGGGLEGKSVRRSRFQPLSTRSRRDRERRRRDDVCTRPLGGGGGFFVRIRSAADGAPACVVDAALRICESVVDERGSLFSAYFRRFPNRAIMLGTC